MLTIIADLLRSSGASRVRIPSEVTVFRASEKVSVGLCESENSS